MFFSLLSERERGQVQGGFKDKFKQCYGAKAKSHRFLEAFKAQCEVKQYVLGKDLDMKRAETFATRAVVGKVKVAKVSRLELVEWIGQNWQKEFGLTPRMSLLANDWWCFVFNDVVDVPKVLSRIWLIKGGSFNLMRWHVAFDPELEQLNLRHLWELFPAFPIELWCEEIFIGLANTLGRFIRLDKNMLYGVDKRHAEVMIELDVSCGLLAEVDLVLDRRVFRQKIDYLHILFRCDYCKIRAIFVPNVPC